MGLRAKVLEGLGYGSLTRLFVFGLQAITNIAVARHLASTDYGIVAYALVYINFLAQFSDIGLNSAAIQRETLDDRTLYTAFTLKAALGLVVCATGVGLAALLMFTMEGPVGGVLCMLSANFVVSTLAFLPQIQLTRLLNFRALSITQLASTGASTAVTILLVINNYRYWSVAAGYLCATAASVLILNLLKPSPPRFSFDRKVGTELLKFGGPLFLVGLVTFAVLNADNFLIGLLQGPGPLGQYALAFNWSFVVTWQIGGLVVSVLFPIYSRIQHDRAQLKSVYLKSLEYTAVVVVLMNVGLFCLSSQFFFLVLGGGSEKWFPALTAFRILCVDGLLMGLLFPLAPATVAIGHSGVQMRAVIVAAVVELSLLVPALMLGGIEGVAVAVTVAGMSQYFVYPRILRQEFGIAWGELGRAVGPAVAGGLAMVAVTFLFSALGVAGRNWPVFLGEAVVLGICFVVVQGLFTNWRLFGELARVGRESFRRA
jgi:O-antigen/teichoic acid export membrane protein